MTTTKTKPKAAGSLAPLLEKLRNPLHLRVAMTSLILGSWYFALYAPMEETIASTTGQAAREKKRVELARDIEELREVVGRFDDRLPRKTDSNEWVQYMLSGLRTRPLKLIMLDTDNPRDLGPFKAIVVRMTVEGGYRDIIGFVRWLETNPRLLRIDAIRLEPQRGAKGFLVAELTVLGVMG